MNAWVLFILRRLAAIYAGDVKVVVDDVAHNERLRQWNPLVQPAANPEIQDRINAELRKKGLRCGGCSDFPGSALHCPNFLT